MSKHYHYFVIISLQSVILYLNTLNSPYKGMLFARFGWNWNSSWFWKRRFLKFVNVFSICRYCLLLEKDVGLYLNRFVYRPYFCFKCLKLFQWFWRGIPIFKSQSLFVAIVSPWKRAWPFIWTNLCRIIFVQGVWLY